MAKKWPGHFSRKSRILSYRSRLWTWAFWAQIRAQEQKIRSKSELRLSLELIFKIAVKWGNPTKWFQQIKTSFKLFMTKVSPMNYYKLRKPQRVYLTWALSFLLSFVNQLKIRSFWLSVFQWNKQNIQQNLMELVPGHWDELRWPVQEPWKSPEAWAWALSKVTKSMKMAKKWPGDFSMKF